MLESIFGNKSAERVLLHAYHYEEIHPSAVARDYQTALDPIRRQFKRFEEAGILISKEVGRSRIYRFNLKSPFSKPIQEIVGLVYESIPLKEKEEIFGKRRRPRRQGKPIRERT